MTNPGVWRREGLSRIASYKRALRRIVVRRGWSSLDRRLVQRLLGVTKQGPSLVDRVAGLSVEYDTASVIGRLLFTEGGFEDPEIRFFTRRLSREREPVILDVGANIGWHSLCWARDLPTCAIQAFEPAPETRAILVRNIRRNRFEDRVGVVNKAVSSRLGTAEFHQCADNAYSSLKDTHRMEVVSMLEVQVTTVDEHIGAGPLAHLSLIKIDVEGLEDEVLRGATETLSRFRPDLFVEIYGGSHSNPDPEGTIRDLRRLGYRAYVLRDGQPTPHVRHSDSAYNYFFTAREDGPI